MGTATYFSPEQAQGFTVDGRSDVYSLGVVLYEMATGVPPFTGESPVAVAMKHVREVPRMPSSMQPDLPPVLESIILAAMAKSVDARYQSAEDLRADLLSFQRGRPVMAAPAAVVPAGADQMALPRPRRGAPVRQPATSTAARGAGARSSPRRSASACSPPSSSTPGQPGRQQQQPAAGRRSQRREPADRRRDHDAAAEGLQGRPSARTRPARRRPARC